MNVLMNVVSCPHCHHHVVVDAGVTKIPIPANLGITCYACEGQFRVEVRVRKVRGPRAVLEVHQGRRS